MQYSGCKGQRAVVAVVDVDMVSQKSAQIWMLIAAYKSPELCVTFWLKGKGSVQSLVSV